MLFNHHTFDEVLKENLATFCSDSEFSHQNLFQATKEIAIARLALQKQAEFYLKAVELLTILLENAASTLAGDPKIVHQILASIDSIEQKSIALIKSSREVTGLLGQAVNIDIDKAALSQMLIRLPTLIKQVIEDNTSDPQVAERIASSLDSKLSELMVAFRFDSTSLSPATVDGEVKGISFDQYSSLYNTVPSQPQTLGVN